MSYVHTNLAAGRWQTLPLVEQLANVGSDVARARELLCDAMFGGAAYGSDLASLDRYFFHFAIAARAGR